MLRNEKIAGRKKWKENESLMGGKKRREERENGKMKITFETKMGKRR